MKWELAGRGKAEEIQRPERRRRSAKENRHTGKEKGKRGAKMRRAVKGRGMRRTKGLTRRTKREVRQNESPQTHITGVLKQGNQTQGTEETLKVESSNDPGKVHCVRKTNPQWLAMRRDSKQKAQITQVG